MKKASASAPGKLMLMGDHAVIYGRPCIVTAVDTRLTVTLEEVAGSGVSLDTPGVSDSRFITKALDVAVRDWKITLPGLMVRTRSEFSNTYGLGSSAAVTVALLFALNMLLDAKKSLDDIFAAAYATILEVQGSGSGFDVAAATYGGTLLYTKGKPVVHLDAKKMPLIVGYSGVKADTPTLVADVAKKYAAEPEKMNRLFDAIAQLVTQAQEAIASADWKRLGTLFTFNQNYLENLGVSSEKLEQMIGATKAAGAYGAKLSGAGGGDCMISVFSGKAPDKAAIEAGIGDVGGQVIHITPHAMGVRSETV
jgi:mevalonate kinase